MYPRKLRRLLLAVAPVAGLFLAFDARARGLEDGDRIGGLDESPATEQYENRAFPLEYVGPEQSQGAAQAFGKLPGSRRGRWKEVGPFTPTVPAPSTYTFRATTDSGRVKAVAISPRCRRDGDCMAVVASAGGGIWITEDARAPFPEWKPSSAGMATGSMGSLIFDPNDRTGRTLYAGTGEASGSSDSEAGVGLYRSTDGGKSWSLVPGSVPVAFDRAIGAVAVEPGNPRHIVIGTAVARHGSSSVNGGRFTPPGSPPIGLYESRDAGASFQLVFSAPADVVIPGTANGADFFRGGVTNVKFQGRQVYFAVMDYGLFRTTGSGVEQVFASAGGGDPLNSLASRTEFALAPMGGKLRIYLGDAGAAEADFYRVDDADVAASALTDGVDNPGWTKLSSPTPGTPGFGSFNFCGGQCSYDMVVASPPGQPDVVWLGGQMQYDELFAASNGRAVQRSADAGVHFTDMTNDTQTPYPLGMHPDQHAIAFLPGQGDAALLGSDGGVVRTGGEYADASAGCLVRGLDGADLADCQAWLSAIPRRIDSLNDGLRTLQFQSVSVAAQDPWNIVMGGTQDNGTWAFDGRTRSWFESINGDGGQSGVDVGDSSIRMHTYYDAQIDVNFRGSETLGWNWTSDLFFVKPGGGDEGRSFYIPLINDPYTSGTWFVGLQHVWRTQDNGGDRVFLEQYCNEYTGDYRHRPQPCGDWVPLGGAAGPGQPGDLVSGAVYGPGKTGSYVVAIRRASTDKSTMWVATRRGRLFISTNADAAPAAVAFKRLDTSAQPTRFISGIAVDPRNPFRAWVSFSGYEAYTPTTPGHVFEVVYDGTGAATWTDLSLDLGDQPITGLARDDVTGALYAATDFGIAVLEPGATGWAAGARGLPAVATYGLTIDSSARVLYAATHGRGVWRLNLARDDD
jgi:hypothetical protein